MAEKPVDFDAMFEEGKARQDAWANAPIHDASAMPFTALFKEADAENLRNNPDAGPDNMLSNLPAAKVIIEQEAAVAKDFADGKITQEEFDSFRALAEEKIGEMKQDLGEDIGAWHDAMQGSIADGGDTLTAFKEDHPDFANAIRETENGRAEVDASSFRDVADATQVLVEVVDPMMDSTLDMVEDVNVTVTEHTSDAASALVEARAEMSNADPVVIDAARQSVEVAREGNEAYLNKIEASIEVGRDNWDKAQEQAADAVNSMYEFADAHDGEVIEAQVYVIEDTDFDDQVQEDTQTAEA
jgi:hypothetical protein